MGGEKRHDLELEGHNYSHYIAADLYNTSQCRNQLVSWNHLAPEPDLAEPQSGVVKTLDLGERILGV